MKTTVVFAHPWNKSFNHALLNEVVTAQEEKGNICTVINLYEDGFQPAMSAQDLAIYNEGKTTDPLVKRYINILNETDEIVFVFPIWWYDMPAMMRGFLDKVLLEGSSFHSDKSGLHPVHIIPKTTIFTTSSAKTDDLVNLYGDPVNGTIINGTFKIVGFHNASWYNLEEIEQTTQSQRECFLSEVKNRI